MNCYSEIIPHMNTGNAVLITAPPGWGKTYNLLKAIKKSPRRFIAIFPLRALCEEVYLSALKMGIRACNYKKGKREEAEFSQFLITTPECLDEGITETYGKDSIYIFDEFHLFYYWGHSFRQKLLECLYHIAASQKSLLLLSATMGKNLKKEFVENFKLNYENIYHLDFGNQKLKNYPRDVYLYPAKKKDWMMRNLIYSKSEGVKLVFCQYRNEVKQLSSKLNRLGFSCLSCVGGEASEFVEKLNHAKKLDFIIATSVVSHGVNLPSIGEIYFLYDVKNIDFYIQMIGRGGRDGSSYNIHTFSKAYFSPKKLLKGFLHNCINSLRNWGKSLLYYEV